MEQSNSILPPPERTTHPFYMYDMIKGIPASFKKTLEIMRTELAKQSLPKRDSITFTGNGTAYYAAVMGSQILARTRLSYKTAQAFDLAHYYPHDETHGITVAVSHSGITRNTLEGLTNARSNGDYAVGVTHFETRPISKIADRTFVVGDGPDKSRCHTKTYIDSSATILCLSLAFGKSHGFKSNVEQVFSQELYEKLVWTVRNSEELGREAAINLLNVKKVFVVGSGPNVVTAREIALKIKESSFLSAEGMMLEEILHGPWVTFDDETLVLLIFPKGSASKRAKDLLRACEKIGCKTMVVSASEPESETDFLFRIPESLDVLSPFLTVIPLYFFSYFLAVAKGRNPDYLRYLDSRYWGARNIIFPPGTH